MMLPEAQPPTISLLLPRLGVAAPVAEKLSALALSDAAVSPHKASKLVLSHAKVRPAIVRTGQQQQQKPQNPTSAHGRQERGPAGAGPAAAAMQPPGTSGRLVGNWSIEQVIGSGSFAVVWKARHVVTGALAAVKEINTSKLNKKLQESLQSEIAVLERTKHTNIVCLLDLHKVRASTCMAAGGGGKGGCVHKLCWEQAWPQSRLRWLVYRDSGTGTCQPAQGLGTRGPFVESDTLLCDR